MRSSRAPKLAVAGALVVGIGLAGCGTEGGGPAMNLRSSAFEEGGSIPRQYTCDGGDTSPPLEWDDVPGGTGAFALIVYDPDARGWIHWVLVDIPGDVRELGEGAGDSVGTPGRNDFGRTGWGGPCPPSGEHRYAFTLYALAAPLGLGDAPSAVAVRAAVGGRSLAEARLTGVYARSR